MYLCISYYRFVGRNVFTGRSPRVRSVNALRPTKPVVTGLLPINDLKGGGVLACKWTCLNRGVPLSMCVYNITTYNIIMFIMFVCSVV